MYDKPASRAAHKGQLFTTETTEYTLKLNYQLSRESTLTFMTQLGRKYQPYRFGSGASAYQYLVESTALQNGRSQIGKVDYMRVISNRATLDTSINVYGTQFPLTLTPTRRRSSTMSRSPGAAPTTRPASRRIGAGTTTRTSPSTPTATT